MVYAEFHPSICAVFENSKSESEWNTQMHISHLHDISIWRYVSTSSKRYKIEPFQQYHIKLYAFACHQQDFYIWFGIMHLWLDCTCIRKKNCGWNRLTGSFSRRVILALSIRKTWYQYKWIFFSVPYKVLRIILSLN